MVHYTKTQSTYTLFFANRLCDQLPQVLPDPEDVLEALAIDNYDSPPYNDSSHHPPNFRNLFEGWELVGCRLHNRVHIWIGGQMVLTAFFTSKFILFVFFSLKTNYKMAMRIDS